MKLNEEVGTFGALEPLQEDKIIKPAAMVPSNILFTPIFLRS